MGPADVVTCGRGTWRTARWVPSVGMVGASLQHRGRELLGQRGGLEAYAARGATFGIPLLHPWANRLGGVRATGARARRWRSTPDPRVRTEEHGLPIHGLLRRAAGAGGSRAAAGPDGAVCAELAFDNDPTLLAAFPFPHRLDARRRAGAGR